MLEVRKKKNGWKREKVRERLEVESKGEKGSKREGCKIWRSSVSCKVQGSPDIVFRVE